jgi:aminobenzoyl-glutamate utilization protein B
VIEVEKRVHDIAQGAALMAGVDYEIKLNSGLYEIWSMKQSAKALQANLELHGPITYTAEENAFAEEIMRAYGLRISE